VNSGEVTQLRLNLYVTLTCKQNYYWAGGVCCS